MMSINPDAHSTREIDLTHWGVEMARKGGVPKERVLNCLGKDAFAEYLARRRDRHPGKRSVPRRPIARTPRVAAKARCRIPAAPAAGDLSHPCRARRPATSWLRDHPGGQSAFRRQVELDGRDVVSGAASPGTARPDQGALGRKRDWAEAEVLFAEERRQTRDGKTS